MSSPSDFSSAATSLSMLSLAAGGKFCFTQSWPTASPSASSVSEVHCFQRACGACCPAKSLAEEARNSRRRRPWTGLAACAVQHLPAQIALPRVERFAGSSALSALKKSGVTTLSVSKWPMPHRCEVDVPVEVRRQLVEIGHGIDVIAIRPDCAAIRAAHGGFGHRGLDLHHRSRLLWRPASGVSPASVNIFFMCSTYCGADIGEVRRCRRCSSRGRAGKCRPGRARAICFDESFSSCADAEVEKAVGRAAGSRARPSSAGISLVLLSRAICSPRRLDGRNAQLLDGGRVHAGGVEVAVLLLQRRLGVFGRRVQVLPEQVAIALAAAARRNAPSAPGRRESDCSSSSCRRRTGRSRCRDRRSCPLPRRRSS